VCGDVLTTGAWRVTMFDPYGASGHFCEHSREAALIAAMRSGFKRVAPGAVDAVIDWSRE
jgi:hypothetical protein